MIKFVKEMGKCKELQLQMYFVKKLDVWDVQKINLEVLRK